MLSLLCCQERGQALWIWGARTREDCRGQGLAKQMLAHVEQHARSLPHIRVMLSTTIASNTAMLLVFQQQGYAVQATVLGWLQEWSIAWTEPPADTVCHHECWQLCQSVPELKQALLLLQGQRSEVQVGRRVKPPDVGSVFAWLPDAWAVWPADSAGGFIEAGSVWLLTNQAAAKGNSGDTEVEAVLAMLPGEQGPVASVVTRSVDGLRAAGRKALSLNARCHKVCIDACGQEELLKAFLGKDGGHNDYLVFYKLLEQ